MKSQKIFLAIKKPLVAIKKRATTYSKYNPHRSFKRTLPRDDSRSLKLPRYFAFSVYVWRTLWANRRIFISLALVYAVITVLMVGMASQDTYSTLKETLNTSGGDFLAGVWGEVGKAGLLFISALTGRFSQTLSDVQQVYVALITLMTWLTSIWLLRNILAGHKVKLKDGLYSSGSPILATFLVALLLLIQLFPAALALIGYVAAVSSGLLAGGVEAMLFWFAAGLLIALSLYWITSTFFALVIVTLPGMYPMQAIRTAGELVIGRRLRILLRLLWMAAGILISWGLIMIPMILFDTWIKNIWPAINWVPIIPILLLAISAFTIVWASSYIYLLYRKVVADDVSSD
jgi:hypothetical protein